MNVLSKLVYKLKEILFPPKFIRVAIIHEEPGREPYLYYPSSTLLEDAFKEHYSFTYNSFRNVYSQLGRYVLAKYSDKDIFCVFDFGYLIPKTNFKAALLKTFTDELAAVNYLTTLSPGLNQEQVQRAIRQKHK